MSRAAWAAVLLAATPAAASETACARFYRDFFDSAGVARARGLDAVDLRRLEEAAHARPERCGPGDYPTFIGRYADLLTVAAADGLSDPERHLLAIALSLAPRLVAPALYPAAFHAFLDVRSRLAAHLGAATSAEGLTLFDEARPLEDLPSPDLADDRDGMRDGLTEIRRLLALGEIAAADARAEEMLRTLQAHSPPPPDGGEHAP